MRKLFLIGVLGLIAQLVDGSLGMAYGVTSTSLLLAIGGLTPALASTVVHLSEVGTTAASGVAHAKFGNVDWAKILWMAVPGAIGAFAGAYVLASVLTAEAAEPLVAVFLFALGLYVLAKFAFRRGAQVIKARPIKGKFLAPLGLFAGFMDAAGGGGWGPISTPTLLSSGRMEPRKVVGTVDTSEFLVALSASVGFLIALSFSAIPWSIVAALLIGGVIAAPVAAWVVKHLNARVLGTAVGGLILITNARTFLGAVGVNPGLNVFVYLTILGIWAVALCFAISALRRENSSILETGATRTGAAS